MTDTTTVDGATSAAWTYGYDAAGRLTSGVSAVVGSRPTLTYTYSYAGTGGCGADTGAGKDSARTSTTVTIGTGTPSTTTDCTDYASRLTSATGGNPLSSVVYNGHGDATTIGAQTITYNAADQVTSLASSSGGVTQTNTYTLDPVGRMITRNAVGSGTGSETNVSYYAYTGPGDSADFQVSSTGVLAERYITLPGGVLLTRRYTTSGGDVWSVPDLHGDLIATTGPTGTVTGSGFYYDPFGQPLGRSGGAPSNTAVPLTRTTGVTDAWEGTHQVGYERLGGLDDILMGARLYLPTYGQFTSTDPIPGGNDNPYMYPADPINREDLNGEWWKWLKKVVHYANVAVNLCADFVPSGVGTVCSAVVTLEACTSGSTSKCLKSAAGLALSWAGGKAAEQGLALFAKTRGISTETRYAIKHLAGAGRHTARIVTTSAGWGVRAGSYAIGGALGHAVNWN